MMITPNNENAGLSAGAETKPPTDEVGGLDGPMIPQKLPADNAKPLPGGPFAMLVRTVPTTNTTDFGRAITSRFIVIDMVYPGMPVTGGRICAFGLN